MTDEQKTEALEVAQKAKAKEIATRKAAEKKAGFLNPFGEGVSYDEFLTEVKASKKSVKEYCKDNLSTSELAWIESELALCKKNKSTDTQTED